ncbi:MAG: hypothetical protein AAF560_15515 [Acidobacteriota bacterium]
MPSSAAPASEVLAASEQPPAVEHRGRLAEEPNPELLAAAKALLGVRAQETTCGPYRLVTDVDDVRVLAACNLLAGQLDGLYEKRFGVQPLGEPAEAIVLFDGLDAYRAFAQASGVPRGYAGYALAARGLTVFYLADQPFETFLSTLAHELTHLISRRAIGINLPPWLSEGLSDAIGDTASEIGFRPLRGVEGAEVQAERLRGAYRSQRAGSVERLVTASRREFDRGAVSFDYEQSALLVRFLLLDPELSGRFRQFLLRLASAEANPLPQDLMGDLAIGWSELDRRFEAWVLASR